MQPCSQRWVYELHTPVACHYINMGNVMTWRWIKGKTSGTWRPSSRASLAFSLCSICEIPSSISRIFVVNNLQGDIYILYGLYDPSKGGQKILAWALQIPLESKLWQRPGLGSWTGWELRWASSSKGSRCNNSVALDVGSFCDRIIQVKPVRLKLEKIGAKGDPKSRCSVCRIPSPYLAWRQSPVKQTKMSTISAKRWSGRAGMMWRTTAANDHISTLATKLSSIRDWGRDFGVNPAAAQEQLSQEKIGKSFLYISCRFCEQLPCQGIIFRPTE